MKKKHSPRGRGEKAKPRKCSIRGKICIRRREKCSNKTCSATNFGVTATKFSSDEALIVGNM